MRNILFCAASLAPIVLSCTPASADDAGDRDEIIVTDSRRDALAEAKAYAESRPGNVDLVEIDAHINDAAFAEIALRIFDRWVADGLVARGR